MTVGYQSIEIDSFDPSIYSEVVADAHFEQRLLKGGRFRAQLRRVSLPRSRLDCGRYSLPCLGRGAMPDGWMNVGFTLRIGEPAADLAVALALVSARAGVVIDPQSVIFGEISLSGALRPVAQTENRLKEAQKLGFTTAILPQRPKRGGSQGLALREYGELVQAAQELIGPEAEPGA